MRGVLLVLEGCILSACATIGRPPGDCPPTRVPPRGEMAAELPAGARLLPGDYRVTAVSTSGRRVTGGLRLWLASAADSGRSAATGKWVYASPEDTVRHPLVGVTDVRFMGTVLESDSTLDQRERATNPIHPQVLVDRSVTRGTGSTRLVLLVNGSGGRELVTRDGAGSGLTVVQLDVDGFRGFYARWGIVGVEHDTGYFCARLMP